MSKAVKWQIPFVSTIEKTKYRIDIYAEQDGTWIGVTQLLGGPQPFVTEENKSDDFFTPVRSQTGNIQVCTAIPAGGTLSLDDILPANNIDHPVRLVSIAANNAETIEWQGFLSCEAYSQSYTSIPQILTLPVISVLEAMDSVEVELQDVDRRTVKAVLIDIFDRMESECGVSVISNIYWSAASDSVLSKYIDTTLLYEQEEIDYETNIQYEVVGVSLKTALSYIAQFMGWTIRESGQTFFFERIDEEVGMYHTLYTTFKSSDSKTLSYISDNDIANLSWRGIDHKKNVNQGAKMVGVVAKLKQIKIDLQIPETPVGSLVEYRQRWYTNYAQTQSIYIYLLINTNQSAYNKFLMQYRKYECAPYFYPTTGVTRPTPTGYADTTLDEFINGTLYDAGGGVMERMSDGFLNTFASNGEYTRSARVYNQGTPQTWRTTIQAGAFFGKIAINTDDYHPLQAEDCLFCSDGLNGNGNSTSLGWVFQMRTFLHVTANSGCLNLQCEVGLLTYHYSIMDEAPYTEIVRVDWDDTPGASVQYELKWGNKYWNGSSWQNQQCLFSVSLTDGKFTDNWAESIGVEKTEQYLIPITDAMDGEITLKIYPQGYNVAHVYRKLSVSYVPPIEKELTERTENQYHQKLSTHFTDEKTVTTDIATKLNNVMSPSLLLNNANGTPTKELTYEYLGPDETHLTVDRRPEVDLLNRLVAYYGAARQTLELKVKHPTAAALPLLKLNGISPDTKKYLPLAESRDWIADVATLTCFETPE